MYMYMFILSVELRAVRLSASTSTHLVLIDWFCGNVRKAEKYVREKLVVHLLAFFYFVGAHGGETRRCLATYLRRAVTSNKCREFVIHSTNEGRCSLSVNLLLC